MTSVKQTIETLELVSWVDSDLLAKLKELHISYGSPECPYGSPLVKIDNPVAGVQANTFFDGSADTQVLADLEESADTFNYVLTMLYDAAAYFTTNDGDGLIYLSTNACNAETYNGYRAEATKLVAEYYDSGMLADFWGKLEADKLKANEGA